MSSNNNTSNNNANYYPPTSDNNTNSNNTYSTAGGGQQQQSASATAYQTNNNNNNGAVVTQMENGEDQQEENLTPVVSPFSQCHRIVMCVFLVLGVGCGISANVLTPVNLSASNVMWVSVGSVEIGLWQSCSATQCSNIFPDVSNSCSSGLESKARYIIVVAMAMCGLGFAFLSWPLCFGRGACYDWMRHIFLFMSFGGWICAIVFWWQSDKWLDCSGSTASSSNKKYGISFWLAVAAGGLSFFSFMISITHHLYLRCCADPNVVAANGGRPAPSSSTATAPNNNYNNNNQNNASSVGTTGNNNADPYANNNVAASNQQQNQNQNYQQVNNSTYSAANTSAVQQQQQQQKEDPNAQFTDLINQASMHNDDDQQNEEFDPRDPASVGLEDHWYFDDASGYWWSDQAQLYYDAESQSYGNPTDGTWYNSETGEWQ